MRGRDFGQGRFEVVPGGKSGRGGRGLPCSEPQTIPTRKWLYGTLLLRGFVTVLVAPGGTGKSLWALAVAASLSSNLSLLGDKVFQPVNTWVINLEDPEEEFDRRFAALKMHYHMEPEAPHALLINSEEDAPIYTSQLDEDGDVVHPEEIAIMEAIIAQGTGMVVIDPLAESHELDENNNGQMAQLMAMWRRIARRTNCAVLLVHHTRKGVVDGADSSRGASAIINSARVALTMSPMTEEEADAFGIERKERLRYVRMDNAKANLAPRAGEARWFELVPVHLGNGTAEYPSGDSVGVITAWKPQSPWNALDAVTLPAVFAALRAGPAEGKFWSSEARAGKRWAGNVLMEVAELTREQARLVIAAWLENKVLSDEAYSDASTNYRQKRRIVVNEMLASQMQSGAPPS